jgi:hypothetical protein
MELFNEAKQATPDARIVLEQRVDYSEWVPDGFGTSDVIILTDDTLTIIDLKYGKGVPVEAEGNPQMRLYALGALHEFGMLYGFTSIKQYIVQPRNGGIRADAISLEDLLHWAEDYVRPRAQLAIKGEGEFNPGEHCRFCKCRAECRAYAEKQAEIARLEFDVTGNERKPWNLTPEEIAKVLDGIDDLVRWGKLVKDYALTHAIAGEHFPGYKVVTGRSNRQITDKDQALAILTAAGFSPVQTMSLRGLGELEEILGKKTLDSLIGDLIVKPEGKPTLVPEDDRRDAITPGDLARKDFQDELSF